MSVYVSASYGSQITLWGIFSSRALILAAAGLSFAAVGEVLFNSSAYIRTRLAVWLVLVAANLLLTNFAVTLGIFVSLNNDVQMWDTVIDPTAVIVATAVTYLLATGQGALTLYIVDRFGSSKLLFAGFSKIQGNVKGLVVSQ
jgi:hypothetical protein